MNKQSSGQKKTFQIKVHAHKKVDGDKLGPHCLIGYVQCDLSSYVGKKQVQVDFEL